MVTKILTMNIVLLMLAGCMEKTTNEMVTDPSDDRFTLESSEQDQPKNTHENELDESDSKESNDIPAEESKSENNEEIRNHKGTLSEYSSEQIEYARVWLQLGPNQELDSLDVRHIPAGTPLDPNDDTSVVYPEDVIQLTGSRIVDGIVTYSGNGDGTINVYNVPRRWYGGFSPPPDLDQDAVRKEMEDIINNTELVYIEPAENDDIIKLIEIQIVHN